MDSINIFIIICLIIIIVILVCKKNEVYFYKSIVLYMLSKFIGNFILLDDNNKEILRVINNPNNKIPCIKIHDQNNFYKSIYNIGELGLGESYVRKEWSADNLTDFLDVICLNNDNPNIPKFSLMSFLNTNKEKDKKNIKHHYDVGNDFYLQFLRDDLSAYSCGFWFSPNDTLNTAQYNKVNTIIKKLNVKQESKILDIGCGWGKIANYVATVTNSKVTGITISDEQAKYALDTFDPNKVRIINMDYRLLSEKFDYIYSIGMFEHVRYENYDIFFQTIKRCLKPNGRFVLHTIINTSRHEPVQKVGDNFVLKHIFPGGQLPDNDWILEKAKNNGLNVIHFEGFGGQHYAKTLNTWKKYMWEEKEYIKSKYPDELLRKYDYYFSICEAGFNTGIMALGHYVIVPDEILSINNSFNY